MKHLFLSVTLAALALLALGCAGPPTLEISRAKQGDDGKALQIYAKPRGDDATQASLTLPPNGEAKRLPEGDWWVFHEDPALGFDWLAMTNPSHGAKGTHYWSLYRVGPSRYPHEQSALLDMPPLLRAKKPKNAGITFAYRVNFGFEVTLFDEVSLMYWSNGNIELKGVEEEELYTRNFGVFDRFQDHEKAYYVCISPSAFSEEPMPRPATQGDYKRFSIFEDLNNYVSLRDSSGKHRLFILCEGFSEDYVLVFEVTKPTHCVAGPEATIQEWVEIQQQGFKHATLYD